MKLSSQQRLLRIIEVMAESGYRGVKNAELITRLGIGAAVISRDLAVLRDQGWADRKPDGRIRLSPKFAGFSGLIAQSLRDARLEIQQEEQLYVHAMERTP